MIHLENISFSYDKRSRPVLDSVSFRLHEKERVGLVGPNGSGKTTLFHIIMGLQKPTSGRMVVFGKEVRDEKDFAPVRQRIGLLFQDADDQLFSPTVLEDVAFGPLNQGKSPGDAREIAMETLESLGLEGFHDRITHKLSGGEKKLVSLATVLAMKPRVLLLDEPTTGLDTDTMERIIDILRSINISYVLISHDMDFISQTTDRIDGMVNGRILLEKEKIPHTHIHSHSSGKLPHTHSHDSSHLSDLTKK